MQKLNIMKLGKKAKELINSWSQNVEDGDSIRVINGEMVLFNGSGCELDRVYVNE